MSSQPAAGRAILVVPCFNEARRLDPVRLDALAASGRVELLFVDDGSTDHTPTLLRDLVSACPATRLLVLDKNSGKAEAVRLGLLAAIDSGAEVIGYYDADLATPPEEMLRLVDILDANPKATLVMGARVGLLGARIQRSAARHYLGRVFASMASVACGVPAYDTQCGAKVLRVGPCVVDALASPFRSRWCFDVELLARLRVPEPGSEPVLEEAFLEIPLAEWVDVGGSKLRMWSMARAIVDLIGVWRERRLREARTAELTHQ